MNYKTEGLVVGITIAVLITLGTFAICTDGSLACNESPIHIFAIFGSVIIVIISATIGSFIKKKW